VRFSLYGDQIVIALPVSFESVVHFGVLETIEASIVDWRRNRSCIGNFL